MKALLLFILLLLIGCSPKTISENAEDSDEMEICSDSLFNSQKCIIYLQPYDNFSKKEAEELMPILKQTFDKWLYGYWYFRVLEPASLPKESRVKEKNKYRVTPILDSLYRLRWGNVEIIGLTHKDICTNIHGVEDYGIVSISWPLSGVCLVSDKRLKNKSLIWKPVLHEFFHTFYGAKHCPNDDPKCFMKDAKGHGNFEIQDKLCNSCLSFMMKVERGRMYTHRDKNAIFPWEDVEACMENIIAPEVKGLLCPKCGKEVKWIRYYSPSWTWEQRCGKVGPLAICPDCRIQVKFYCEGKS